MDVKSIDKTPSSPPRSLDSTNEDDDLSTNSIHCLNEENVDGTCGSLLLEEASLCETLSDKLSTGALEITEQLVEDDDILDPSSIQCDFSSLRIDNLSNISKHNELNHRNVLSHLVDKTDKAKSMKRFAARIPSAKKVTTTAKPTSVKKLPPFKAGIVRKPMPSSKVAETTNPGKKPLVSFSKVGLLKRSIPEAKNKAAEKKQSSANERSDPAYKAGDDLTLLRLHLQQEMVKNQNLSKELDRCQQHMREAAETYIDLGNLAMAEKKRADDAEKRVKELETSLKDVKHLLQLEKEKNKNSLVTHCNAAVSSLVGGQIPSSCSGFSLEKIETSLKTVLAEVSTFKERNNGIVNQENSSPARPKVVTEVFDSKNSPVERGTELRRMVQLLIAQKKENNAHV